jgi:hypothetical protein
MDELNHKPIGELTDAPRSNARADLAAKIVALLGLHRIKPTGPEIGLWLASLAEYSHAEIVDGLSRWSRGEGNQYGPPTPNKIAELCGGSADYRAAIAWQNVIDAMNNCGAYVSPVFDDPKTHYAIRAMQGGWIGLCHYPISKIEFARNEFVKVYKSAPRHAPPQLDGIGEEVVFFGDKKACLLVYKAISATAPKLTRLSQLSLSQMLPRETRETGGV